MPKQTEGADIRCGKLSVDAVFGEQEGEDQGNGCRLGKVEHEHPPRPFPAEGSFEVGKAGVAASAFADILMIDEAREDNGGVEGCDDIADDRG